MAETYETANFRLLGELLRLQKWAGGDAIRSDRLFGLLHGFESVLDEECHDRISRETQEAVEDLLEAIDRGDISPEGLSLKSKLREIKVSDEDAQLVVHLCNLQGRHADSIKKITSAKGAFLRPYGAYDEPSLWDAALHYMELVDSTTGARTKMHAVLGPCVPRVSEYIEPENGPLMKVIAVTHVVQRNKEIDGRQQPVLVPHLVLKNAEPV